ncbi:acylglycerol lipase [Malassezia cuniculi]|uniref:Acylglycerol lipase n=1 Tax=Malassezia cuniculi TaxID=948313 RepID=A0AAF0EUQ9_9BASI|nr:acylglycerol lipase [Malassezia cuniculi]
MSTSADPIQSAALHEEWFDLRGDGERLYFLSTWYATDGEERIKPKAAVVYVHGFAECIHSYDNAFRYFAKNNYEIHSFDQRGYGRTWYDQPGRETWHGWTTWNDQFFDVSKMIELTRTRLDEDWGKDEVPIFLMGHSMGGGISAGFFTRDYGTGPAEETKSKISGVLLSAPWLDIHNPIGVPTSIAGVVSSALLTVFPRMRNFIGLKHEDLCRDPEIVEHIRREPIHSYWVYGRGLLDPLRNGPRIVTHDYVKWPENLPLLIVHGTADRITRYDCSEKLVARIKAMGRDAELVTLPGFYHQLMHEPGDDKIKAANAFISWLDRHVPSE